ncbi:hypothetical protein [Streptomyces sp. TS71-3]|uniref:hypothetical protein n=1 Tax=Streptomyces sp. TS71-3 TaxID=2733862 RepID=UPI001B01D9D3|nr:hypothetical protein [Streptomyces sp. TS71-3]GHJ39639.1 hypothetical protein Sm713_52480 [Streptomyces sp. TS71-3]
MVGTSTSTRRIGSVARRSRMRRVGESAYGLLLLARHLLLGLLVVLVVAAGVWASWHPARAAMGGAGRGTMTVTRCTDDRCTGTYAPASPGAARRDTVVLDETVGIHKGAKIPVATAHGDEVVRTGSAGLVRACLPLGGALVLAAVVIAGGLRLRKTGWVTGLLGLAVLAAAALTM